MANGAAHLILQAAPLQGANAVRPPLARDIVRKIVNGQLDT